MTRSDRARRLPAEEAARLLFGDGMWNFTDDEIDGVAPFPVALAHPRCKDRARARQVELAHGLTRKIPSTRFCGYRGSARPQA
jgi:hypothetical protein